MHVMTDFIPIHDCPVKLDPRIDADPYWPVLAATAVAESRQELLETGERFRSAAYEVIGHSVDFNSEQDLQAVLFDELGLPPTPGHATDSATLYALRDEHPHPFLDHLLVYRAIRGITQQS
jgi:DNA polymerase I-like protein with 3'-5' exonuclease and polymerase domains